MGPRSTIVALLLAAGPLPGQHEPGRLTARAFLPAEHTLAAHVDVEALVESDLWDGLERSMMGRLLLGRFRGLFGFELEEVRRLELAMVAHPEAEDHRQRQSAVLLLSGSERVGLRNPAWEQLDGFEAREVRGQRVLLGPGLAMLSPRPGELVFGDPHHVLRVLEGEVRGGVPRPELMPLTAGAKALAYFAALVGPPGGLVGFDPEWLDPGDPVRDLAARLVRRASDGHLVATVRLGFERGDRSPARLSAAIEQLLAETEGDPRWQGLRKLVSRFDGSTTTRREGEQLVFEIDLGPERDAPGLVQELILLTALLPNVVSAEEARAAEKAAAEKEKR